MSARHVWQHTLCAGQAALPLACQYALHVTYKFVPFKGGKSVIVYRELNSLETDLGFPLKTLYSLSNNVKRHYKTVCIPKRDGGVRKLSVPDDILKKVQRSIAENILAYIEVSSYATAYKYGSAVQKNARPHVGAKKLLKLDILHFFDSIYYSEVKEKVFPKERFSEPVRVLLTVLCYYKDALPQGAPTSPAITNIIMRDFDEKVGKWCESRGISYTRYCDDMTFSADFDEKEVKEFVKAELLSMGFILNEKKTVSVNRNKRMMVTGVVVNQKINAPAEYKRTIRQEVYYCKKFGVGEHIKRLGHENKEKYLQGLLGRIAFVLQMTPNNIEFNGYKSFVKEALKNK